MYNLVNHYSNGEKLYEKVVSEVCKKYEITYMEFNIIMFLHNNPKFDTATEIIKYRHLAKSHVSTSIKSCSEKKLLTTQFLNDDKKTIHLKLTNEGEIIAKDGLKYQKRYIKMLTENFTDDEVNLLQDFLIRVDENIDKYLK